MIYKIINPSDPYVMEAQSLEVAAVALAIVGDSAFAGEPVAEGNHERVPILAFSGNRDEWFTQHFGVPAQECYDRMQANPEPLLACLESFMVGTPHDIASYRKGLELIADEAGRLAWREHWHDTRRSSLNDIGRCAWETAQSYRVWLADRDATPTGDHL